MFVFRETPFSTREFYHGQLHLSQSLVFVCFVLSGAQLPKGNFAMLTRGINTSKIPRVMIRCSSKVLYTS